MATLPIDAVHPNLEKTHDKLVRIAEDRPGLLGEFVVLSRYLMAQVELLKTKDVMMAYDFYGDPGSLIRYSLTEGRELGEEVPIFNSRIEDIDGKRASSEGGDVLWLMAMRLGVGELHKSNKLKPKEVKFVVGMMGIIGGLEVMYPEFKPEESIEEVAIKNNLNYPTRVLRAPPAASVETMAKMFERERFGKLKNFRSKLSNRKITEPIHTAIHNADRKLPVVPEVLRGAHTRYKELIVYARDAANHYAY